VVAGAALETASKLSVLVVDDDQDIREYLQDFLLAEGFEVTTLADPTLAVERIRDEVFHLVVLDLMMPKISGSICSRRSGRRRRHRRDHPDRHPSLETASASIQHEVSAYIPKPFTQRSSATSSRGSRRRRARAAARGRAARDDRPPDP
jgi:DNA-binding NtrC family response regulator